MATDAGILTPLLSDAAHVPGGHAAGVAFPRDAAAAASLVASAARVLPVGAQSSLTGGATPRGDILLSTRALTRLEPPLNDTVRVGAGVPLKTLQAHLAAAGKYYPPVPTYDGAFVGGTIATNAAGAATFKYGSTRQWVDALSIVLADGSFLEVARGEVQGSPEGWFEVERPSGAITRVPIPGYTMPSVPKLSAGYFSKPGMDLVDLFIGSEGTLGVIIEARLRVIARPLSSLALIACDDDAQALRVTSALRDAALNAWQRGGPLDVAAVEYMDERSLGTLPLSAFDRAGVARPRPGRCLLLAQLDVRQDADEALAALESLLSAVQVTADPVVTLPGDVAGAARLFELREAVPAAVNARIGAAQSHDAAVQKTAGDMIVAFDRLGEWIAACRREFERRGLDYAIWGHVSDGNLHPNVIPANAREVGLGIEALRAIAGAAVAAGGAPLAEHGVGRSPFKQELLRSLYGEAGIAGMRAVKRALDPAWKLAPGVLFPAQDR